MRRLTTGEPEWDLVFDQNGTLADADRQEFLDGVGAEGVADVVLFSHGWNTSEADARQRSAQLFPMVRDAMRARPQLGAVGFAGIYWPSLWFPEGAAAPRQAVGSAQAGTGAVVDDSSGAAALSGAEIAASLAEGFPDKADRDTVDRIGLLIDDGKARVRTMTDAEKEDHLSEISALIRSLVPPAPPGGQFEDAGETALLLAGDPKKAYLATAGVFGSAGPGASTQGIGDWFSKALDGAKDAVRVLSYNIMKARAGDIGRVGLGPLLAALRQRHPTARVHLVGHSFGARLVSYALSGVGTADQSPVASLVLVQGAFSHWAFARAVDNPFGKAGALNTSRDRVHGPLVATFSPFDWAVCTWYPKASFLAQQDVETEVANRWGGMGSDGFQAVAPRTGTRAGADGSTDLALTAGTFFAVDASAVINNVEDQAFAGAHSDIYKPAIARLIADAAAQHG